MTKYLKRMVNAHENSVRHRRHDRPLRGQFFNPHRTGLEFRGHGVGVHRRMGQPVGVTYILHFQTLNVAHYIKERINGIISMYLLMKKEKNF